MAYNRDLRVKKLNYRCVMYKNAYFYCCCTVRHKFFAFLRIDNKNITYNVHAFKNISESKTIIQSHCPDNYDRYNSMSDGH